MDMIDRVRELASRIPKQIEYIQTEEATKNALIMPFIHTVLGYNVFDPTEVIPEFIADVGTKKGEKVDYAIHKDGKPIILFECKAHGTNLDKEPAGQLRRYFNVTEARFGVLTDGVVYRFYTDLDKPNIMDQKPFLDLDLLDIKEDLVDELKKFAKTSFDTDAILSTASDLKYGREIKRLLAEQWANPTDEFVKFFARQVYSGFVTKAVTEKFRAVMQRSLQQFVSDRISDRLKLALADEKAAGIPEKTTTSLEHSEPDEGPAEQGRKVSTTSEELEGYYVVKAILCEVVDIKRIAMRDALSYCSILLDNTNRKPICRLRFTPTRKYLVLFDEQRNEQSVPIEGVDDIYKFGDRLKAIVSQYEQLQRPNIP